MSFRNLLTLFIILAAFKGISQDNGVKQVSIDSRYIEVNKRFLSSLGISTSMPVGNWSSYYGPGAGIFYEGRWLASDKFSVFGNAGYNYFFADAYDGIHQLYLVPGARLKIAGNFYSFLGAGLSYATIDRHDQTGLSYDAGFGIDFISSKKRPLRNGIPVLGIRAGMMGLQYEDLKSAISIKFIMTFTKSAKEK